MRTPSAQFLLELSKQNYTSLIRANVLLNGEVILGGLAITEGEVTRDRRRTPRATLSLTVAEPTHIPTPTSGVLSPLGYEIQIFAGMELRGIQPHIAFSGLLTDDLWVPLVDGSGRYIVAPGGGAMFVEGRPASEELMSLGIFPIQKSLSNAITLLTQITAVDRTQWLEDDIFEADYVFPDSLGGSLEANIERLIRTNPALSDPGRVPCIFAGVAHSPPTMVLPIGTPKWSVIEQAARSIGYEAYFDGQGWFRWGPAPNLQGEVVWDFTEGNGGDLVDVTSELDRGPMYNRVIAVGSNADATSVFRGTATDDNPLSPTRYGGPAGKKQRSIRSALYTSNDDATAAAEAELENTKGVARSYAISTLPNYLLEEGDVSTVTATDLSVSADVAIIDAITYPFAPEDTQTFDARTRDVISP